METNSSRNRSQRDHGIDRVRRELMTALHLARLTPGDRAPSVRELAGRTGLNLKTIHRAYTRLAQEGLLDLRPGSGSYISESNQGAGSINQLLSTVDQCKTAGQDLGLDPALFGTFLFILLGQQSLDLQLAVVECNQEQIGLISYDIKEELGHRCRSIDLSELVTNPHAAVSGCFAVVTTDCHRAEVAQAIEELSLPIYCVALDPSFPKLVMEHASNGPVILVVRDRKFGPVFKRLLHQISNDPVAVERVHVVETLEVRQVLESAPPETAICISPLVAKSTARFVAGGVDHIDSRWRIEKGSMNRLRIQFALDVASRIQKAGP